MANFRALQDFHINVISVINIKIYQVIQIFIIVTTSSPLKKKEMSTLISGDFSCASVVKVSGSGQGFNFI